MMSEEAAKRVSLVIGILSFLLVIVGLVISILAQTSDGHSLTFSHQFFMPVLAITYGVVGSLVHRRHPRNPIGWMFCATGFLSALTMLAAGYTLYDQFAVKVGSLPGATIAHWMTFWLWIPLALVPITFVLLLFPNGRLPSARWRPVAWAAGLGTAAITVASAFDPGPQQAMSSAWEANPFGIPAGVPIFNGLAILAVPLLLVGIIGSIASVVIRFRNAAGMERAQIKWLAFAGIFVVAGNLLGGIPWLISPNSQFTYEFGIVMTNVTLVNIVIATGVAILRYRLWDIDVVINRTLVYGALTVLVVAIYVLLVGTLGTLLQSQGSLSISLFGTGIVAVFFQPLRERLQRSVNRLMYGERDNPYAVLAHLSERLEVVIAPQSVLPTIVETVADAFKLPYAAIRLKEGETFQTAAEFTRPSTHGWKNTGEMQILPLVYQSETVGEMILAPRVPGEQFSETDRRLLETIARQAGVAAYNVRLTQDLQRSRERLVTTREEERRRLRRDLHDGLGPILAAMSFKLDAVHNLAGRDPDSVKKMAAELKTQVQAVLGDIRRIAYGLRPPALDELGLVGALKAHIASYNQAQGLDVTLDAPEDPPSLPAAVEVATYRIALEAMTNVSRHARAKHCCVRLSLPGDLCLEVTDDGRGLPNTARAGVGLTSMRERAEELGGTCRAFALPHGGTEVIAHLPLSSVYATVAEGT